MKKLKSSLTNMVLVLTLITIVAGSALAYVNYATEGQIEKIKAENLAKGIKQVMGVDADADFEYTTEEADGFTLYRSDRGTAIQSTTNGFGGPLKVLVGFDAEGTVLGYTILEHAETPGLGAKAADWFQKGAKGDIIGRKPGERKLQVSKDTNDKADVDAITASTITSRAFLLAVQNAYDKLNNKADGKTAASAQGQKGGHNK